MTKVAVVFAEGFEEIEALSPVDVFRRAGFDCNMLGLESASVTGSHGIQVAMDGVFDGNFADYDLVVLPGGMPGSTNLSGSQPGRIAPFASPAIDSNIFSGTSASTADCL